MRGGLFGRFLLTTFTVAATLGAFPLHPAPPLLPTDAAATGSPALGPLTTFAFSSAAQVTKPAIRPAARASGDFDRIARDASAARESNDIARAIELYRTAVTLRPSFAEGWWYLGTLLYESDRYAAARRAFQRLTVLNAKHAPATALLGLCEFREKAYRESLAHLQRAHTLGLRGSAELERVSRFHVAILLTRFGQFELAYPLLRRLARSDATSETLIQAFGLNILRMRALPDEAPGNNKELVDMAGRAAWLEAAQKAAEAAAAYADLCAKYPDTPDVHYAYGTFLLSEHPEEALHELERELEISPSHVPARVALGFELLRQSRVDEALEQASEAVKRAPDSFAARQLRGRALLQKGEISSATAELKVAVKLAPDSPQTHFALAAAYAKAGRKNDAQRERLEFQRLDKLIQK